MTLALLKHGHCGHPKSKIGKIPTHTDCAGHRNLPNVLARWLPSGWREIERQGTVTQSGHVLPKLLLIVGEDPDAFAAPRD